MLKRLLLAAVVVVVLVSAGVYFWAHAIFASDTVRQAVEAQLSTALGHPVRIGGIGATVFPRVTIALEDVRIGEPAHVTAARLDLGAALGALLSRRIEQGSVRLVGARVTLPLPPAANSPGASVDSPADAAVEIVSIDEVLVEGAEIVSGGRTLRADLELGVAGRRLDLRRADLNADGAPISVTGRIDDPAGPTGQLTIRAATLDVLRLATFAGEFSAAGVRADDQAPAPAAHDAVPMQLDIALETERAMLGTLRLDGLSGSARVTDQALALDPVTFGTFGGQAKGAVSISLAETPAFTVNASLVGVDLAEVMKFVGHPDLLTGRLAAHLEVNGRGVSPALVLQSTAGTARIDATDGSVKGLGLVRAVVLAGSMRGDSQAQAAGSSSVEPFTRLGATLSLGGGRATTRDLRFESNDLLLDAAGGFGLDGSNVDLAGKVQLSDALTAQAGRDLVRYTAEQGRVTLPASITGSAAALRVRIDTGAVMKRAITNRANEEIKKGLGRLLGR